jgi:hypothetical protein
MQLHFNTVRTTWIQFVAWLIVHPPRPVSELASVVTAST